MKRLRLIGLTGLIIIPMIFLFWLVTTEGGLHWSYQQARSYLPAALSITQMSGRLIGPLTLQSVKYEHQGQNVIATQVTLDWNPWGLFQAEIDFSELQIQSLDIAVPVDDEASDPKTHSIQMPQITLPLGLHLDNAEINAISIKRGDTSYRFDQIRANARISDDGLEIENLEIDSESLNLSLQGSLKPTGQYPHDIKLDWRIILPSGASVESKGRFTGDMTSTRVIQKLQGALQLNLVLELRDLLADPSWQSEIEATSIDTKLLDPQLPPLLGALQLTASGDMNAARISGQLNAESAEFGRFSADFKLSSLDGEHRFDGLQIDALEISAFEGQISANGQLNWLPNLHWETDISASKVNPASLLPQWPGSIEAHLNSSGKFEDGELSASANITRLSGSLRDYPISLQSQLQWKNNGVDVTSLNFVSGDTRLSAEGRIGEALDLRWSLDSNNLAELYPQAQGYLKASGRLEGPRESPIIKASFIGKSLRLPGYELGAVNGEFDFDLLQRQQFNLRLVGQALNLQGHSLQSLEIIANPERIRANLIAADAKAQIALNGALDTDNWRGQLVQLDIQTADYSDWKLKAPSAINLSENSLTADSICLRSNRNSEICSRIDGQDEAWKIDLDVSMLPLLMLNKWIPPDLIIEGLVNASANLEYRFPDQLLGEVDLDLPQGVATYTLEEDKTERFEYRFGKLELQLQATGLQANTTLELVNGDRFEGKLGLPGANLFAINYETQILQASARLHAREFGIVEAMIKEIDQLQGVAELDIEASGTLARPRLQGKARLLDGGLSIPKLNLEIAQLNIDVRSENYEAISYRGDALIAGGSVVMHGDTILNAATGWPSKVRLEGESLDIGNLIKRWLPPETKIDGLLNANAALSFNAPDHLVGEIELSAPSGTLNYPLLEGEIENWEYRDARLSLIVDQQGIRGNSEISIGDGNIVDGNLTLPGAKLLDLDWDNQALDANAKLIFNELAIIEALVPDIDRLGGSLTLSLNADGTLASPILTARAEILEAAVSIPKLGVSIDQISLRGASDSNNLFQFQLEAHSGDGTLAIKGSSRLDAASGWPTTLEIKGNEFEAARIPEATINVSPDLVIELQDRSIDIRGDLLVPYAKLQPKDVTSAAQVSNDTVIIDSTEIAAPKWLITTRVNLILGDRVSFFGFGFEGQLGGKVLIEEEAGQLLRGIGEINVPEGRYRAYGQRLDIENGRLFYTGGPLTNPGLDIRAIRKTGNVTAGIEVRGTLKQPQLELFSIPAMGQTDALSYLLLGRPMETASGEDGAMMAQAALALGLAGGDKIARTLGDRFGLDEMRVESDDSGEQASLVLGRYLSPRLYVSYGVGLIGAFNSINLRYQISEKWQFKADSGESHGADFMYTIER